VSKCLRESFIFDALFDAWRSTVTGHRVANGDWSKPVPQTRSLPIWPYWFLEHIHRWVARRNNPDRMMGR